MFAYENWNNQFPNTHFMQLMQETQEQNKKLSWLKKLGAAGFLFFLVKGILWLILFGLVAFGFMDEAAVEKIKNLIPF